MNAPDRMTYGLLDEPKTWDDADSALIENRTEALIQEKFRDLNCFRDLMAGIESDDYIGQLHRALVELDKFREGDPVATMAVAVALTRIEVRIKDEMQDWHNECWQRAEKEMAEGELE